VKAPLRIGKAFRDGCLIVGLGLLLFVSVEGILFLVFRLVDQRYGGINYHLASDVFADSSWAADYFREDRESAVLQWHSYTYWRRAPYAGKYVSIDRNGIRSTIPPSTLLPSPSTMDIFMFGGSTMWGVGSRDAFTIPSNLARELLARGVMCNVVNFGEDGYVSTQEVVDLALQLREGHIPDLVIFYDGFNDTFSAWQQKVPGRPQNESDRVKEFNLANPSLLKQRAKLLMQDAARGLATLRFANTVLRRAGIQAAPAADGGHPAAWNDSLPQAVVDTYLGNIDLVRAMGEHYGFQCLFFWQPNLFEKPHRTPHECEQWEARLSMEPFFRRTYELVRERRLEQTEKGFHDLSLLFVDTKQSIFFDGCHVGEPGSKAISQRMLDNVMPAIAGK